MGVGIADRRRCRFWNIAGRINCYCRAILQNSCLPVTRCDAERWNDAVTLRRGAPSGDSNRARRHCCVGWIEQTPPERRLRDALP